jgi:hypothetical protein
MDEQELKEKLYSALNSKAELNDLCEKLQVRDLEREKHYRHAETLIAELSKSNETLREELLKSISHNESEQKAHAELKSKYLAKIKSLWSENASLKTRINELEVELQEKKSNLANTTDAMEKEIKRTKHFLLELSSQSASWNTSKCRVLI